MSVAKPFRKPLKQKLNVELKCAKLYSHTLHMLQPGSKIGSKLPKILKSRLENSAYEALACINAANKKDLNDNAERVERRELQSKAKTHLNNHTTAVTALHAYRRLPDRKLIYWYDMIEEVDRILDGWIDSDMKRSAKEQISG